MAEDAESYRILSSRIKLGSGSLSEDAIQPSEIRHRVEDIFVGDRLDERYNFIDYHFERDGAYCRARTYVVSISNVAIFGPFAGRDDHQSIDAPELREAVLDYLKRRFAKINELGGDGYVTIWSRPR